MPNGVRYVLEVDTKDVFSSPYLEEIDTLTADYSENDFRQFLLEKECVMAINASIRIKIYRGQNITRYIPVLYMEDEYNYEQVFYAYQEYLYHNQNELRNLLYKVTPGLRIGKCQTDREKKNHSLYKKTFSDVEYPSIFFEIGVFLKGYLNSYLKYRDTYFFLKSHGIILSNSKGKSKK